MLMRQSYSLEVPLMLTHSLINFRNPVVPTVMTILVPADKRKRMLKVVV